MSKKGDQAEKVKVAGCKGILGVLPDGRPSFTNSETGKVTPLPKWYVQGRFGTTSLVKSHVSTSLNQEVAK